MELKLEIKKVNRDIQTYRLSYRLAFLCNQHSLAEHINSNKSLKKKEWSQGQDENRTYPYNYDYDYE